MKSTTVKKSKDKLQKSVNIQRNHTQKKTLFQYIGDFVKERNKGGKLDFFNFSAQILSLRKYFKSYELLHYIVGYAHCLYHNYFAKKHNLPNVN